MNGIPEAELRIALAPVANDVWPVERLIAFCADWYAGMTSSQMGKKHGLSKGGIIGKAARLAARGVLEHRPNPREPHADQSPEARRRRERKRELDYRRRKAGKEFAAQRTTRAIPTALNKPLAPAPKPKAQAYVPPPKYGRVAQCCWPIGEPGTPAFHFCDKPTDPGRPYCHTHVGKAYTKAPAPLSDERRA